MIEQSIGCITDSAQQSGFIEFLGQFGHQFGELDTGQLGVNRFENTFDVVRDVGFRVPKIQMARPTLQIDKNDMFGFAESSTSVAGIVGRTGFFALQESR